MYAHIDQMQPMGLNERTVIQEQSRGSTYQSSMSPRVTNLNLQRSRAGGIGGGGGGGVMTRVYQSIQSTGSSGNFGQGLASLANFPGVPIRGGGGGGGNTTTALVGFNVTRQRDKRELVQLNDKFAQYIEKVRFLEAQNRKLLLELEALRSRSGQGSSRIKEMYDIEMVEAGKLIEISKRDAAAANAKAQQAEQEVKKQKGIYTSVTGLRETDRKEIDNIERKIAENQAQINLFHRRIADLDDEARRYKAESQRISAEIGRLQNEIQNERFLRSSCDVEKLALDDELTTLRQMHEADLAELRAQSVSNDLDPSHFFRNELAQAIQEIRNDYENVVEGQRADMHSRYSLLYNELIIQQNRPNADSIYSEQQRRQEERFRSDLMQAQSQNGYLRAKNQEVKNRIDELKRRLTALRDEGGIAQGKMTKEIQEAKLRLEQVNRDYDEVSGLKTTLEKEINTYRDLLESQNGLRGYVDRIVQSAEEQALGRTGGLAIGGGGSSTVISRTIVNSSGTGLSGSYGSAGGGGISAFISQSTRPTSGYQTASSVRTSSSYRENSSSASPTRRN